MYSDFNGKHCWEAWNSVLQVPVTLSSDVTENLFAQYEDDPEHVTIIIHFDSTLPENTKPPFRRGQDAMANYTFTVKQHALAEKAKAVKGLQELEDAVRFFQRDNATILMILFSWMRCL